MRKLVSTELRSRTVRLLHIEAGGPACSFVRERLPQLVGGEPPHRG